MGVDHPEGTCKYNVTHDHELRHVEATKEIFENYKPRILNRIKTTLEDIESQPMPHERIYIHEKDVDEKIIGSLRPILEGMDREIDEKNLAFDTRKEYKKLTKICPKE